ncbi:rhomboid family intramembrane serine protease [Flavobacterium reichenbachii]|uniref:Protease n=1 Tax=Flavobacterium reichenbachii TaxID=362418 RepID=A0A085ZKZ6_9FLAO|nr:rhomboid family intramembrane serine protease [Flavobacterium reichenbachii]KFF05110.1 protease [Flavobacterium reichenbachii]OXB16220.1 rhomboid family intramembrane serine protease [Flavobacterium reichenbachii]
MMKITPVVKQLIIINLIFYIGSQLVPITYGYFSLFYPGSDNFRYWQPFTHMFMHAGWPNFGHILFNMFALYSFGSTLEYLWGGKKMLFFYISCGLGSALILSLSYYVQIHYLLDSIRDLNLSKAEMHLVLNADYGSLLDSSGHLLKSNISDILNKAHCTQEQFNVLIQASSITQSTAVGASGAIYGLLIAFAFLFPNAELALLLIPIPIKAKYFVSGIVLIDLYMGLNGGSLFGSPHTQTAYFGHVGGALTGFLMMLYWKKNQFNNNRWN